MPEGPEVKIIADQLNEKLQDKILYKFLVNDNVFHNLHEIVKKNLSTAMYDSYKKGKKYVKILNVKSKGKFLYFKLALCENDDIKAVRYLGNHLGLTGHWLFNKGKYSHVVMGYLDGEVKNIYYDDMRQFGDFVWLTPTQLNIKLNNLGPDILSDEFTKDVFLSVIDKIKSKRKLASILHDQTIFSGIGNYLRAEIIYAAGIDPFIKMSDLSNDEKNRLYHAIVTISQKAYKEGGTITGKYTDPMGKHGNFNPKIYGVDKIDGKKVKTIKVDSQTLYYI
jgi:DNA-formamidopyrimidine glycosylase